MLAMFRDFTATDWLGVFGSLVICAAYFAVSEGFLDAELPAYHVANGGGSVMLLISLYFRPNPGAVLIEALWLLIALWSLGRIYIWG